MLRGLIAALLAGLLAGGPAYAIGEHPRGVRHDQRSASSNVTGSDPTWNHTPRGFVSGVVVFCIITDTSSDVYTGATYGGVSMTATQTANDTATELAFIEAYFLGSGIPQGLQQVICDSSDTTLNKVGLAYTFTADQKTTSDAGSCGVSENTANPSCTITGISRESLSVVAMFSGLGSAASTTAASGFWKRNGLTIDAGTYAGAVQMYMQASGNNTAGFTSGSDDVAMVAVAIEQ